MSESPRGKKGRAATSETRAYHHGNLRRVLLDAALGRLANAGDDFTLRDLAREVGVTHNAPYRHFRSKAELLAALRDEGFVRLAEAEKAALAHAGASARERVRALGEAYVRFAIGAPVAFRLMMVAPPDPDEAKRRGHTESFGLLLETLESARAAGETRGDLSARELALAAWSLVHGLASLLADGRVPAGEEHVRRFTATLSAVFWEGVVARAPSKG